MERILLKRYRILKSLGRGGLGSVYLCDDLRLPGKQWALKQMRSPQPGMYEKFRETFEREAATLSRLRHPNMPVIVDYFEVDEEAYLVMEFVDGENLAEYVNRCGPLDESLAFEWGEVLIEILWFLHNHEPPIIFRDLKPENVMRTEDGTLKLVDFGLARRFVPGKGNDTMPSGSVGYAAPEQWEDLSQTDERSDIYSWGATLVFLLTGKIPSPVFPLSPLRQRQPPMSEPGRAILARSVKARPRDRYVNVDALGKDVRKHLDRLADNVPPQAWESQPRPAPVIDPPAPPPPPAVEEPVEEPAVAFVERRERERPPRPTPPPAPAQAVPTNEIPRFQPLAVQLPLAAPLVLMVLATLAFVIAVAARLPLLAGSPTGVAVAAPPNAAGEPAYQQHFVRNDKKDLGRRYYHEQRWAEAIDALDQACTLYPDDVEAQILKDNAYIQLTGAPSISLPYIGTSSGVDGLDSFPHLYGLSLAQSIVNARGGIHGKKILLDCYDDESSVSRCIQIAQQLVANPLTLVVIGPTNSQRTLAVAPVFNGARVNLVAPTASSEQIWEAGQYVFSAAESRKNRLQAVAEYVVAQHFKSVGVVMEETSRLSGEMARLFREDLARSGVSCLSLPSFVENPRNFNAQVSAVRQMHPDVIFFSDYRSATLAQFAAELRSQGLNTPLLSQSIPFTEDLVDRGGPSLEGLIMSDCFHPQIDSPRMRAFMASFRRKFGNITPTTVVCNTFDATMAVADGLELADTREGLNAYFRSTGVTRPPFQGIAGEFALGKRLDARPARLIQLANGRFHLLDQK